MFLKECGLEFEDIRFLSKSDEVGFEFDEMDSAPMIKLAWDLIEPYFEKPETNRLIADVSMWGFKIKFHNPELDKTRL